MNAEGGPWGWRGISGLVSLARTGAVRWLVRVRKLGHHCLNGGRHDRWGVRQRRVHRARFLSSLRQVRGEDDREE